MARRLRAFHTPDTWSAGGNECRPFSVPHWTLWPYVYGALALLTEPRNWEQVGTATPEEMAETFTAILYAAAGECGETMTCLDVWACLAPYAPLPATALVRVNAGVPQFSLDGGTTWTDLINPDTGGTLRVPDRTATPGTDKLCLAATRARNALAEFYRQTAGAVGADLLNTANQIFNFLNAFTNAFFEAYYSPYDGLLESVFFDPIELPTDYADGELDATALDALLCLLLANATETAGVVSFDYQAVYDNMIAELGANPGTAVTLLVGYLGEAGLNRAGDIASTDTADCTTCDPVWCYDFDFSVNDGGWYAVAGAGVYNTGVNWETVRQSDGAQNSILRIQRDWTGLRGITDVTIYYTNKTEGSIQPTNYASPVFQIQTDAGPAISRYRNDSPRVPASGTVYAINVPETDSLQLFFLMSRIVPTGWDGEIKVTRVVVTGTGENPFGADNC